MLAGAKQEGTSDGVYSRNQPSVLEDDREPQRQTAHKARYSKYGLTPCGNGVLSSATIMDEI